MIYLLIVLALILGTLLSVLFLKAKVIIEYDGVKLRIKFRSGLIRISIDSDSIEKLSQKFGKKEKTDGADPNTTKAAECGEVEPHRRFFDKVEKIKLKYLEIRTVVDIFLRCIRYRVDFSEIYVKVRYGTGDAPSTGVLYGAVWALIGNLYSFLCRYFTIAFPQVDMEADFNKIMFDISLRGIISVRPVHIIIAIIRSIRAYKNHKDGK